VDITWLGHGCFRLRGKNATAITDPFPPSFGIKLPKLEADLVTVSHRHPNHSYTDVARGAYVVDIPGEFEISGVSVFGIPAYHDETLGAELGKNTIFLIEMDDVRICHLGDLGHKLDEDQSEAIGTVDVLLVPVGGKKTIPAATAAEVVRLIEPRLVVPMHYATPGIKEDLFTVDTFLKEMGVTDATPVPKLAVQSSLGGGDVETKVVLLEPRG
jgi:L-ascorbate metabolism protein UlaG (beta-lactamase superfamily)